MEVNKWCDGVVVKGISFTPRHTFECGQAFRWQPVPDSGYSAYKGVAHGRVLHIEQHRQGLYMYPCTLQEFQDIWRGYFDLDRDYDALAHSLRWDQPFQRAHQASPGLRLLRQQPWEALISFILSANNNIARIKKLVMGISRAFGQQLDDPEYFAFPTSQALASAGEQRLRELGLGYRAGYVAKTAQAVANGFDLSLPYTLPIDDARKHLMRLSGVGPKVADCVLLFGYARLEAFPVDVWVQRVLQTHYGAKDMTPAQLRAQAARFGHAAGYAQQVLFYYQREHGREDTGT